MTHTNEITRELQELGTQLAGQPRETPYRVPSGYFESLSELILLRIHTEGVSSAAEELEAISPLLAGLKKKVTYSVPEGYFHQLPITIPAANPQAKVVSMSTRKIFRYAAAAVVTGLIVLAGWFYTASNNGKQAELATKSDPSTELIKLGTLSEAEMAEFVEAGTITYTPDANPAAGELADNDVQWLLSDVSDQELEQYLKQNTPAVEKFN